METNKKQSGGKFISGFFWGAVIGAGVVVFLKTQKGKDILKKFSDEGLDQLSQLTNMDEMIEEEEEEQGNQRINQMPESTEGIKILHVHTGQVDADNTKTTNNISETKDKVKKQSKKFFKGLSKK